MDVLLAPPTLLAVAAVAAILYSALWRLPSLRRRALARFARKVELPAPPADARGHIEGALVGRSRAVGLAASGALGAAAVIGWLVDAPASLGTGEAMRESLWAFIVAGATATGAAAGAAWFAVRQVRRPPTLDGPRMARPIAAAATDYVAPFERWGARVMGVAPTLGLVIGLVIAGFVDTVAPTDLLNTGTLLAAAVAPMVLLASELAMRRLVELPQVAGSSLDLAWNDALRAQLLRDIVNAPLGVGVYASFALLASASAGVQDPVIANGLVGLIGLGIIVLFIIAVVSLGSRPQRYFRDRLWAAGDGVVQDGARQ